MKFPIGWDTIACLKSNTYMQVPKGTPLLEESYKGVFDL